MSIEDAWVVKQAEAVVAPVVNVQRVREPDRTSWLVAAVLLMLAGAAEAATLLGHTAHALHQPLYDSVGVDVDEGMRAAVLITCGVLLLARGTRQLACGLVLGVAAIWTARYFFSLRPSWLSKDVNSTAAWLFVTAFVLQVAGAVIVLTLVIQRRGRERRRQGRPDRVAAVLLALAGALLWSISNPLAQERVGVGTVSGGIGRTVTCCDWSQVDGWNQTGIVLGGIMAAVLAVFAATVRSKPLASGLLFGAILLPVADVIRAVVSCFAPMLSFYGIGYSRNTPGFAELTVSLAGGFWIGLAGVLLLAAAAVSRLLLGPRQDRYRTA